MQQRRRVAQPGCTTCGRGAAWPTVRRRNREGVANSAVPSLPGVADMEVLGGGIANAGAVVRLGDHVLRPSSVHTPTIHAFLRFLRDEGFEAASRPIGVDADGRERLTFIRGRRRCPAVPGVGAERHGAGDGRRAAAPHA